MPYQRKETDIFKTLNNGLEDKVIGAPANIELKKVYSERKLQTNTKPFKKFLEESLVSARFKPASTLSQDDVAMWCVCVCA